MENWNKTRDKNMSSNVPLCQDTVTLNSSQQDGAQIYSILATDATTSINSSQQEGAPVYTILNTVNTEQNTSTNLTQTEQAPIYTLLPTTNMNFSSSDIQTEEIDEELMELLRSWGCSIMYNYLHGEKITVYILKIIKERNVKGLISGFKYGDRILFEHQLEKWRNSIDMPFELRESSSSGEIRSQSTPSPSASRCSSPYSSPEPDDSKFVGLSTILSFKKHGQDILDYYNKNKKFESKQRQLLITLIAEYFEENSIPMSLQKSYALEKEILEHFPTETLHYYRNEKRGKIYTKLHNIRRSFKPLTFKNKKLSPVKELTNANKLVSEAEAESCVKSLNFDNLSAEEFDSFWLACSQHRLLQIRKFSTQTEIFEAWPQYKDANGYRLIEKDFNTLYPQSPSICENWDKNFKLIKHFLLTNLKEKKVTEMLIQVEESNFNKEKDILLILKSLHNYLYPTRPVILKSTSGNKKFQRFTIKDSQQAFIFEGNSVQQIEDHLDFLHTQHNNIQPFILAILDDSKEEYMVYLNEYKFKFKKLLRAVDICLKIFFVFDLHYPPACEQFWVFIQFFFYDIPPLKKDITSRLSTIVDVLKEP